MLNLVALTQPFNLSTHADTDDLREVLEELTPIKRRADKLGIALGLSAGSFDPTMESVVQTWLDQNYNTQRHQLPSYRRLVSAVASKVGGSNPTLAKEIAANHPGKTTLFIMPRAEPQAYSSLFVCACV